MSFGIEGTILVYYLPVIVGISNLKIKKESVRRAILIYCGFITAIAWQVGSDFNRYVEIIKAKTTLELTLIEPVTEIIYFITNQIGEPRFFWVMLALITYSSLFFFLWNLEESEKDGTIIMFFLFFGIIGIALRQVASVSISMVVLQNYYNKRYKQAGILLLLAWSIHKTAILVPFIPILGFLLKKCNKFILALAPVAVLSILTLYQYVILSILTPIPLLGKYWHALMVYEEGLFFSPLGIAFAVVFGVILAVSCDSMRENLSEKNYEFYLVGLFGLGLFMGFSSIHAARLMLTFGAIGLPAFTHFFKVKTLPIEAGLHSITRFFDSISIPGIFAVVLTGIFFSYLLVEHNYIPYNISKDIHWESDISIEEKLGLEEPTVYYIYSQNAIVEKLLIPFSIVSAFLTTLGYLAFCIWRRLNHQNQIIPEKIDSSSPDLSEG